MILKSILGNLLSVSLLAPTVAGLMPALSVEAGNKNVPITYEYYTTVLGNEVPESWLFVGTFLMSAKSLSAEVYQGALDSREEYKQPIAYYSSELDGGAWKNIEGANSIITILPASEKVKEKDLYPYLITAVVGDDGIPRDPVSGKPIDIFTTTSLYDMENLPELEALYNYYQSGAVSWSDVGSKNYLYRMLFFFFENDDLDFDRTALDASAAFDQYKELVMDRNQLEDIWDKALTTDTSVWPQEYSQIMQVMRNWPNIRDDVTDRADREEALLGSLFLSLQEQDLSEEADSALYVERQIDAARRARIYYNLTLNDNITGSYGVGIDAELEALQLEEAELKAYLAQLALDIDKAESVVKKARQAVYDLEDDNEAQQEAMDAEQDRWAALDNDSRLDELKAQEAELKEDFAPIEAEYNRLNAALDDAYNASVTMNGDQTALSDEIDALLKKKDEITAGFEAKIKELENDLSSLKTRKTKAEGRRAEYEEAYSDRESYQKNLDVLYETIETEKLKLAAYVTEAENYTSSRSTANADDKVIYDPEKKQKADRNVSKQQKLLNTLKDSAAGVENKISSLDAVINEIYNDLNLDDEIEAAQKALDDAKADLPAVVDREIAAIMLEIENKQAELAAMSDPYQEKLKALKEANDAYNAYTDTYQKAKQALEDKQREVMALEDETEAHDKLIESYKDKIDANNALIKSKEKIIPMLQAPVDAMNDDYIKTETVRKQLDSIIKELQNGSVSPYDARIRGLKLLIDLTHFRIDLIEEEKKKLEDADKELEKERKQKDLEIENAEKFRIEDAPAQFEEDKKSIEDKYRGMLDELSQQKEETVEQKRQALLEHEAAAAEDPQIKKLDELAAKAGQEAKNALELKDKTAKYVIIQEKIVKLEDDHNKADEKYQAALRRYENTDKTVQRNSYLSIMNISAAKRDEAGAKLDEARAELSELEKEINDLIDSCGDYSGAAGDDKAAAQYYRDKKTAAERALAQSRSAKETLIEEYRVLGERWDAKIAEFDPKIQSTQEQKDDALLVAEEDFLQAQERRLDEIKALKAESEELLSKRAENKLERSKKEERISYLLSVSEEYRTKLNEYQAKQQALSEEGNFGVAPTLNFLKDAAISGSPEMGRRYSDMAAYRGESFSETAELSVLLQDAYTACLASYDSYTKKSMKLTETPAEYAGYILSRRVASTADNEAACMPYLQMLTDLRNIEASEKVHEERETSFLYTWLLPFAITDFNNKRTTEVMDTYHRYLKEVTDRDTPENGIIYIEDRLEYAKSLKNSFIKDNKEALIESHIMFLEGLLEALRSRLDDDDEGESFSEYEQRLLDEKERALSENDPSRAKMIDALLEGLRSQRSDREEGSGEGNNPEDESGLSEGTTYRPTAQTEIVKVILDEIKTGDQPIDVHLGKLQGLPGGVGDLVEALDNEGLGDTYKNEIEEAMANAAPSGGDYGGGPGSGPSGQSTDGNDIDGDDGTDGSGDTGGEGGSGGGSDSSGGDSRSPGRAEAEAALRPVFDGLDEQGQAALVAALAQEAEQSGNDELLQLAVDLLNELLRQKNTCIYKQYLSDRDRVYVSLAAMDKCRVHSGFRYVRRGSKVTMSQLYSGSASYIFTIGSNVVEKNNGEGSKLSVNAVEQADNYIRPGSASKYAYIADADAKQLLGCDGVYIKTTDWAILITPGMADTIKEVAEILNELAARGELNYNPGQ